MGKKLTLNDIKKFIEENDIEHQCILLSTEYINSTTPLKFRCKCGEEFERDYSHLKRKRFTCLKCAQKKAGESQNLGLDYIKKYIQENDVNNECTLLSETYINQKTPLRFKCNKCGEEFERDAGHLLRGRFNCPTCGRVKGAQKLKYTSEYVKNYLRDNDINMIGEYINAGTGVLCECKQGHQFNLYFSEYLNRGRSCPQCAIIDHSGENHWNYNGGGHQEVTDMLRHYIAPWKKACLKEGNYQCDITGRKDDLIVHHFFNFSQIVKQASQNTGIPILNFVADYTLEEREKLSQEVLRLHTLDNGVVLNRDIHNQFHEIYGKINNTKKQYIEFKKFFSSQKT